MDGRVRVGLREVEDRRAPGDLGDLRRKDTQIEDRRLGLAQETQAGRRPRHHPSADLVVDEVVLAIADEGEEPLGHPAEERSRLERHRPDVDLEAGPTGLGLEVPLLEFLREPFRLRSHRRPVLDRGPDIGHHRGDGVVEFGDAGRLRHAVDLDVDQRFARLTVDGPFDSPDVATLVSFDAGHRVGQQMHAQVESFEEGQHRVDDERHVFGDQVDHRVAARPTVDLGPGVVDADEGLGGSTTVGQFEMPNRRGIQLERRLAGDVLGRNAVVVEPHDPFALAGVVTAIATLSQLDDGVDQIDLHLFG